MPELPVNPASGGPQVRRRTLALGAAWSVPVVAAVVAAPAYAASGVVLAPSFTRLGAACLTTLGSYRYQYEYWVELDNPAGAVRRVKIVNANLSAVPLTLTAAYDSLGDPLPLGAFWGFTAGAHWLRLVFEIATGVTGGAVEINYLWGEATGPVTQGSSVLDNLASQCPLPAQPPST